MKQLVFSLLLLFTAGFFANAAAAQESRKPNIILIMADDVSWECFGSYGADDYQTPHIDRLAQQGMRFTNCYSTPL
tara:strand:+ start:115 stop:342 length:228 start_codon:yes stop_codon:yes gene_type:complete